ncbi:YkgJ family cysteine cluster protein [Janthinobacterium sp. LM6]|uniref:YkgJ family cysteine cluster protein n=1 Tax=Janthinobacterium sp. LM6 TaxID=1938606 RepID=UPI0015C568D6|nr:YkgJ family cysteine cluster protein [Janthinobacterium sp. LM6]
MGDVIKVFGEIEPSLPAVFNGLGKGPVTQQTMRFYTAFEDMITRSNSPISCKSGCTYCCHYHVMVSATETFAIAEAIEKLPQARRDVVIGRVHNVAARTREMTSEVYTTTNVECAMLLDGKCSIYAARPIACRGHHSTDVSACKETFDDVHSTTLGMKDYHREVVYRAFDNAQLAANLRANVDATKYELHAALSTALNKSSSFKRWKSGKSAFPEVADKVTLAEMGG